MESFLTTSSVLEAVAAVAVLFALVLDAVRFRTRAGVVLLLATVAGSAAGIGDLLTATLEPGSTGHRFAESTSDALFVSFAFLLYAFSREFEHRAPRLDLGMALCGIALVIASFAFPPRPLLGESLAMSDVIFFVAVSAYFETGVIVAAFRLSRDARHAKSPMVRSRMTGLVIGMCLLAVAFVVAATATAELQLGMARLVATTGAIVLVIAYLQPSVVRAATIRHQRDRMSNALMQLLAATDPEAVRDTMLPLIADVTGAVAVVLTEPDGTDHAWVNQGMDPLDRRDMLEIQTPGGRLYVRASPYASVLGTEELTAARLLATYALLALDRCKQLQSERDAVHELTELKNAFIAATAHDLRTPLTSVLGFAITLQSQEDQLQPQQRREMLDHVIAGSVRLQRLLDDLLEISRLDMRGGLLQRTDTDLLELAREAVGHLMLDASTVTVTGDGVHLAVDEHKVQRVVENLVTNADRHTQDGSHIQVHVAAVPGGGASISIDDDGPGVPEQLRTRVFEPFERGGAHSSVEGSGLGLAIVQRFTVAHGGRIELTTSPLGGARFVVHLPAPATVEAEVEAAPAV